MKKKIILFFYVIIILLIGNKIYKKCNYLVDRFEAIPSYDQISSIDDSYGRVVTTYKNPHEHKNCCLVKKVYNKKRNEFEYEYQKLDKCNYNMIPALKYSNMNLFIDGLNGWNNNKCRKPDPSKDVNYLGSCKRINFECKDFMTPKQCKKFNMEWSDKTCYKPYSKPFHVSKRKILYNSKTLDF